MCCFFSFLISLSFGHLLYLDDDDDDEVSLKNV